MKKDKKIQNRSGKGWLAALAVAGAVSCLSILGLYIYHFPGPFSPERDHWGSFGDFYGGVLNPLLSFLALIALIYTIRQQQEEIEQTRAEMKASTEAQERSAQAQQAQLERLQREERKEDLLRIIDAIYREILDKVLPAEIYAGAGPARARHALVSSYVGEDKDQSKYDALNHALLRRLLPGPKVLDPHLEALPLLQRLRQHLVELGGFMDAFDELAQDERMITDYYRRRLWPIAQDLTHLSIMEPPEDALFHDASMRGSGRKLGGNPAAD